MIEDFSESVGKESTPIPIHNVNYRDLCKVVEYCKYHMNDKETNKDEKKEKEEDKEKEISPWDRKFCEMPQNELFSLINAVNFLNVKPLLNITCKTVANMTKGKSVEQLRTLFNIKNDFTKEEEDKIKKDNERLTGSA